MRRHVYRIGSDEMECYGLREFQSLRRESKMLLFGRMQLEAVKYKKEIIISAGLNKSEPEEFKYGNLSEKKNRIGLVSPKRRVHLKLAGSIQFQSVTDKRSQSNVCGENSMTIVTERKIEDDASSSGENVDIEEKSLPIVEAPTETSEESHAAQCSCPNCDEILSRFSECSICLEPLQNENPKEVVTNITELNGWMSQRKTHWSTDLRCSYRNAPLWSVVDHVYVRAVAVFGARGAPERCHAALGVGAHFAHPPCPALRCNDSRGCTELLTSNNRAKHEEECKHDSMLCPITSACCAVSFEELSAHLQSKHNIIAVYSQKIKILIENFQTKLKNTAFCRTKYKMVLLFHKSAFVIKVCIYNYHLKVEVMRRKLGYTADEKSRSRKGEYCALIEFQSKSLCTKSAIQIENGSYSKKAELQWSNVALKSENDEAITIHVNIAKSESDHVSKVLTES
ncbi:unnamed protein product [Euphydryas editha]|uniref:RING-type E3 ubiquitin transferase n=1 Tax=Euphydryas editha TaxID=104508 RepID=A0AAU9TXE3_EUPED|nr:unnamed protein product [Euphydryas editha]